MINANKELSVPKSAERMKSWVADLVIQKKYLRADGLEY